MVVRWWDAEEGSRAGWRVGDMRAKLGTEQALADLCVGVGLGKGERSEGVGGACGQSAYLAGPFSPGAVRVAGLHTWAGLGGARCVLEEAASELLWPPMRQEEAWFDGP